MCRNFRLIQNIENVSIDELLVHMNRRLKLYMIFFVIEIVTFILSDDYHATYVAFSIITLVLYILSMLAILRLRKNPTSTNALMPIIAAVFVLVFNIFDMTYTLIKSSNYWALFTLISIGIQLSTLFILHKLREKLVNREQGKEEDDVAMEQPIENSSTHNNSTHGGSTHSKHMSNQSTHSNHSAPDIENPMNRA